MRNDAGYKMHDAKKEIISCIMNHVLYIRYRN